MTHCVIADPPPKMPKQVVEVTWLELNDTLGVVCNRPADREIFGAMAEQAKTWIQHFEQENDLQLTPEERADIEEALRQFVEDHWSIGRVLANFLDVDGLVDSMNTWSRRGVTSGATDRRILPGDGIVDFHETEDGVRLTLAPPFIAAYIDARHCREAAIDDGLTIKDMTGQHVLKVLQGIFECEGRDTITIDLMDWDKERDMPSFDSVQKMIDHIRQKREKRHRSKRSRSS